MSDTVGTVISKYWSDDAEAYDAGIQRILGSPKQRKAWVELFIQALGIQHGKVLDVGTGPGIIACLLAAEGFEVTAIDASTSMLALAEKNAQQLGLPISFFQCDTGTLPFSDRSFDGVVNRYVLWTLHHPEEALKEWFRVLKHGKKLAAVDGNWYQSIRSSLFRKMWRNCHLFCRSVKEKRNIFRTIDLKPDILAKLPLASAARPETDIDLLIATGFTDVDVSRKINEKVISGLVNTLRMGYWGDLFLLHGRKP
jgi:ubiquinone/menaquinone biosynthesis C-methylase UbiE